MFLEIIDPEETFELRIGESVLVLRRLDEPALKEIRKRHTRKQTEFVNHRPVRVEVTDEDAVNADVLDYVIVGWRNVRHPVTKAEVPCTRENKLRLPGKAKLRVLNACDAESLAEVADGEGDDLGNSSSSSGSGATAPA